MSAVMLAFILGSMFGGVMGALAVMLVIGGDDVG